jgi:hypothetical protein
LKKMLNVKFSIAVLHNRGYFRNIKDEGRCVN